jgi:RNA polymerase sigma-70 factor (ECF subfamily)
MTAPDNNNNFEAATLPHLDAAYNLAWWLLRERAAAEDVVQESMLRALTYFHSFHGVNPRAWFLRIVRNEAYGALNARRHQVSLSHEPVQEAVENLPDPGDTPEMALLREREHQQLRSLIADLPTELRECLVLRELEDLPYKDIAQITGVPVGTVMSRLWRARQLLIKPREVVSIP